MSFTFAFGVPMRKPPSGVATTVFAQSCPFTGLRSFAASAFVVAASWLQAAVIRARPRPATFTIDFIEGDAPLVISVSGTRQRSADHRWRKRFGQAIQEIGRASCRERVCQYV